MTLRFLLYFSFFLLIFDYSYSQTTGCTDPNATNYNPDAVINDYSCIYQSTEYAPILVNELSDVIFETSSLVYIDEFLWTHNDGGQLPYLYKIDPENGLILDSVYIKNAENIDWEALTRDDTHLYIGDFGNNSGSRTDLRVLKLPIAELHEFDSVEVEFIYYSYPDQYDFTPSPNNTLFDCEAFFYRENKLYLFTKDWTSNTSSLYLLPTTPGTYEAEFKETLATLGLITDATHDKENKRIILLGYNLPTLKSFAYLIFDYDEDNILYSNRRRIELGSILELGQTEGITFINSTEGFISGEAIHYSSLGIDEPAKLHRFDFSAFFGESTTSLPSEYSRNQTIHIYPNPTDGNLLYVESTQIDTISIDIYGMLGRLCLSKVLINKNNKNYIDISTLRTGNYIVKLSTNGSMIYSQYLVKK